MKRVYAVALAVLFAVIAVSAIAEEPAKLSLKVGDEVFVCGCGADCPCNTISMVESKCACGKAMVKGKVAKVGEDAAVIQIGDREQTFKTVGKYACACGEGCKCRTISQNPGNCACGKPLKEVKAGKAL